MGDTPNKGETADQQKLENNTEKPSTPSLEEKKTEDSQVEELRKKAEQAEMRANQLANQLKAKEDAEAAAKEKKLKEKEEFKQLYEQSQAKLDELQREREAEEHKKAVSKAADTVLAEFTDEVKALAEDTGLSLTDATDEAVAEYKGKLEKIQTRLGHQRVTPNNPGTPSNKKEYSGEELREILHDPVKRDAYYRAKNGVTAMMMAPEN